MTLSEFVMAHYISEFEAGRDDSERYACPPLNCDCVALLRIEPRSGRPGPWTEFMVSVLAGATPRELKDGPRWMQAGDLVRLLERLGWPEAQLGERWKKRGGHVPAGR